MTLKCLICKKIWDGDEENTPLSSDVIECKCGLYPPNDWWTRQKYMKFIQKYGQSPEILSEILTDLEIRKL